MLSICFSFIFILLTFSDQKFPQGFVYLQDVDPSIAIDLKYFSTNNFVGDTINGYNKEKCIITAKAAEALSKIQNDLKPMGYGLKVYDAYRPQQAVDHFVRWAKDSEDNKMKALFYPDIEKKQLFQQGYISSKSGHTRGSAVDLTLIYLSGENKGKEVDMGTPWDFFSPMSWPSSDDVTAHQKSNRMVLQAAMVKHGFRPYKTEWWHFTLNDEPFPDIYFNFPVE